MQQRQERHGQPTDMQPRAGLERNGPSQAAGNGTVQPGPRKLDHTATEGTVKAAEHTMEQAVMRTNSNDNTESTIDMKLKSDVHEQQAPGDSRHEQQDCRHGQGLNDAPQQLRPASPAAKEEAVACSSPTSQAMRPVQEPPSAVPSTEAGDEHAVARPQPAAALGNALDVPWTPVEEAAFAEAAKQVSHGLQLKYLWTIPTAAVS